ncbi:MAG: cyclic nucleotide-binding domain-containing protein [Actinomycetota bacterium]
MARKKGKIDVLQNVWLFSACTSKELGRIASLVDEAEVPKGATLTKEGATGKEFFAVAEGAATAKLRGKKIASYGPGDFFGEMALIDQGPRSATITADTAMKLYVLDSRSFSTLIDRHPAVARKILRGLAGRLRKAEKAPTH